MTNSKTFTLFIASIFMATIFFVQTVGAHAPSRVNNQIVNETDVIIYGSNSYGSQEMVELNLSQETFQYVGTASLPNQAMAQDPLTQYVYFFEWQTSGNEFAYWNPATQTNHTVRVYSPAPGFYAKRMDFAPDGTLYLMDGNEKLYIIDKQTGDYTYLGTVTGMVTGPYGGTGDMAFAPDGTLYIATYENIYTVNLTTLTATLLFENMFGNPTNDIILWTGLAFCDGALYGANGTQSTGVSSIIRVDPITGVMEEIIAVDVVLNDLSSCAPKVEICDLQSNMTYDFYIEPFTASVGINDVGTLDCISMNRSNANHPQATPPLKTGYYWRIEGMDADGNPATNFDVSLTLPTTFTTDLQDKVCRYTGSGWNCAMSSIGTNSVTRDGIVEFSDWTVGNDSNPTAVTLEAIFVKQAVFLQAVGLTSLLLLTSLTILIIRRHFSQASR